MSDRRSELRRDLGTWSAVAIVVGTVIGSGIFLVPKTMVARVGTPEMVFAVWIFGGVLSLFGALTYAELSAALPEAGGEYVDLREAYGPFWGFMYSDVGGQERVHRHAGNGILSLPGQFFSRFRSGFVAVGCASRPQRRAF